MLAVNVTFLSNIYPQSDPPLDQALTEIFLLCSSLVVRTIAKMFNDSQRMDEVHMLRQSPQRVAQKRHFAVFVHKTDFCH